MTLTVSQHLDPFEELPDALPRTVVEAVIASARSSPCQKSHRGAVVFGVDRYPAHGGFPAETIVNIFGAGFNGQPPPWRCDGTCSRKLIDENRSRLLPPALQLSVCSMMCQHAEQRAIRAALVRRGLENLGKGTLDALDIVHLKVGLDGRPAASERPSCWQCSGAILDSELAGVWLYEKLPSSSETWAAVNDYIDRVGMAPAWPARWRRYTAEDFHMRTLANCGLVRDQIGSGGTIQTEDLP